MKIYTKTGDTGQTSLLGKDRFSKANIIFDVLGTLDELNAILGQTLILKNHKAQETVRVLQADLFELGSLIANVKITQAELTLFAQKVTVLERQIDYFQRKLPELTNFILPGGTTAAANLHLARAVCRRVERSFVLLLNNSDFANLKIVYPYLNRLSDLLFVLARFSNYTVGVKDQIWKGANV